MSEHQDQTLAPADGALPQTPAAAVHRPDHVEPQPGDAPAETAGTGPTADAEQSRRQHSEAGRKGARRVHQLIQAGRQYEQEHGLKRGRQRLRQLIELGKLYELEHGLRPRPPKRGGRLSRPEREELLATLLQCLLRIAKPSFRADLGRLVEALQAEKNGQAA